MTLAKIRKMHTDIDVLVHCAGIRKVNREEFVAGQSLEQLYRATNSLSYKDLDLSFRINVFAQYFLTAGLVDFLGAAAKRGDGRGSVICFCSVASKHTGQFVPAYQTSKAAVDHLVKILAAEFADHYSPVKHESYGPESPRFQHAFRFSDASTKTGYGTGDGRYSALLGLGSRRVYDREQHAR